VLAKLLPYCIYFGNSCWGHGMIVAAIMCGGKGSRMGQSSYIEKPLLRVKDKTMIEYVLHALVASKKFERIVGVSSSNTPKTSTFLGECSPTLIDVIETEGTSYSKDLSAVLRSLKPAMVFVVSSDLPLLNAKIVQNIIFSCLLELPCISIVSEKQYVQSIGIKPSLVVTIGAKEYCHSGISIIDSSKINKDHKLEEYYIIMNEKEIAVNVNTRQELDVARGLL
jgi:adenosylcobinamide-phosphate guanylyltransferase